jgi:type IV secretory pathway VirB10-like protein
MSLFRLICCFFFVCTAFATLAISQEPASDATPAPAPPSETILLTVAKSTPLQVALDREVRVKKAGQPVHGRVVQPIYAFDRLVVPAGTEVNGRISTIQKASTGKRVMGVLNADLTPPSKVQVEFDELVLDGGKRIPFHAAVTPGSGQVIRLVSAEESKNSKGATGAAKGKISEAKEEVKRQWQEAMKQVKEPGKMHRIERYAVSQLPVRPQYIPAGTLYFAELQEPLDFGTEPATPQLLASIGSPLPAGSHVHALLVRPLDSATTQKGAQVEAVLTQPVFDGDRLILPQGSRLKGVVLQAQPARRMHHNGKLRITFREIVPPDGVAQKVVASLEAVQAARDEHVKLDSEGGAEAATPKTRYASTALSVALASVAFHQHTDADDVGKSQSGNGVAGGAVGFRLVGIALGLAVKSQPFGMAMGAYGASRSVYSHFISRGQDVVFPKNTAMEIGIGARGKTVLAPDGTDRSSLQQPEQK